MQAFGSSGPHIAVTIGVGTALLVGSLKFFDNLTYVVGLVAHALQGHIQQETFVGGLLDIGGLALNDCV